MRRWYEETWPTIRAQAKKDGGEILFADQVRLAHACRSNTFWPRSVPSSLANVNDRQQCLGGGDADLLWRRSGWSGDIGESLQQSVEGDLALVDGGAFITGERDAGKRLL
ncbi:hypothetical protein [Streptomyces sp. NPDC001286]